MLLQHRFQIRVRQVMDALNISQSELARRMKVAPAMVSSYLNGGRSPGFDVVEKFACALGIEDPATLLRDVQEKIKATA